MSINKNELTKEQIAKAMSCETAEDRGTDGAGKNHRRRADERGSRGVHGGDGRCGT